MSRARKLRRWRRWERYMGHYDKVGSWAVTVLPGHGRALVAARFPRRWWWWWTRQEHRRGRRRR